MSLRGRARLNFQPHAKLSMRNYQRPPVMKKLFALTMLLMLLSLLTVIPGSRGQEATNAELRAANDAWNDGKYATALRAYIKLLNGPAGDQYLEAIALQTGELYQTTEFTTDG